MKINAINSFDNNTNYQKKNLKTFQGYINGKFYRDEVILEAKKALNNPDWKSKLIANKRTLGESLATWHQREGSNDIAGRILMGIFTLGLTEVTWGLTQAALDASDNRSIDKMIKEVEDCLETLESTARNEIETEE